MVYPPKFMFISENAKSTDPQNIPTVLATAIFRQFEGCTPENKGPDLQKILSYLDTENIKARIGKAINQQGAWITGVGGNIEGTSFWVEFNWLW